MKVSFNVEISDEVMEKYGFDLNNVEIDLYQVLEDLVLPALGMTWSRIPGLVITDTPRVPSHNN
jgi:hypothetical protein